MAADKSNETKLTRSEAVEVITIACTSRARAAVVIDKLADAGVPFAPEPVGEPSDPLGVIVKDCTGKLWCWDARDEIWKCSNAFIDLDWSRIPQPVELFRKGECMLQPAPAIKYTAYRDKHGDIRVNGFPYPDGRRVLRGQIARRQAALDLLNREAGK